MKRFLVSALALFVLVSFGSAFAQVQHDVTISVPDVAFLRFTATDAATDITAVEGLLDVAFLLDTADVGSGAPIAPSNTPAWGDVKVFVNYESEWEVTVTVAETSTASFDWNKVGFGDWNIDGGTAGSGNATGWSSLGFGGSDLRLTLDGTEIADDYSATVTYTLTAP